METLSIEETVQTIIHNYKGPLFYTDSDIKREWLNILHDYFEKQPKSVLWSYIQESLHRVNCQVCETDPHHRSNATLKRYRLLFCRIIYTQIFTECINDWLKHYRRKGNKIFDELEIHPDITSCIQFYLTHE